jgi:tRNA G18 (ribose-2'-O)-methylase SpoU
LAVCRSWVARTCLILGVELAEGAVPLADLAPARGRTVVVLLGHESTGIPPTALDLLDQAVEIPMLGTGQSLNGPSAPRAPALVEGAEGHEIE